MTTEVALDLDGLLTARLVVARYGEMDLAKWWNTKGALGRMGGTLYARGMPRTHPFARARIVFEIAAQRCREIYQVPDATTLWAMPAEVEDAFADRWHHWLAEQPKWAPLFARLEQVTEGTDLLALLESAGVVHPAHRDFIATTRRVTDGRAVPVNVPNLSDDTVALLAGCFSRGEAGKLAVPFLRVDVA